jgi:hypothetical protein
VSFFVIITCIVETLSFLNFFLFRFANKGSSFGQLAQQSQQQSSPFGAAQQQSSFGSGFGGQPTTASPFGSGAAFGGGNSSFGSGSAFGSTQQNKSWVF